MPNEECITDFMIPPDIGVCIDTMCSDVGDCPLAPVGGTASVQCTDVTGEGSLECVISCGLGESCPTGMLCALGLYCAWPALP